MALVCKLKCPTEEISFLTDFDIDIRVTVKDELLKKIADLKFESEVESILGKRIRNLDLQSGLFV